MIRFVVIKTCCHSFIDKRQFKENQKLNDLIVNSFVQAFYQ